MDRSEGQDGQRHFCKRVTGDGSPWYPSMRLFRQPRPGDWQGIFAAMQAAISGS